MEVRQFLITNNRPRTRIEPRFVTIHNTGNPDSTAINNRNFFQNFNPPDPSRRVSAHWVVDDREAIQCIPEGEMAWHAGPGNSQSIGVEVCEFTDPAKHEMAYRNAVMLSAAILTRWGLRPEDLTTHKRWTGKNCPHLILPKWVHFVSEVGKVMNQTRPSVMVNNRTIATPVKIANGRTYVQLDGEQGPVWVQIRSLSNLLNAQLAWDEATQTAKMIIGG